MSRNPPQTLSVKRKRNEAPVDSLVVERPGREKKRLKSDGFSQTAPPTVEQRANSDTNDDIVIYRRIQIPNSKIAQPVASPVAQPRRRFLVSRTIGQRVLVEDRPAENNKHATDGNQGHLLNTPEVRVSKPASDSNAEQTPRLRKRPGPGSALNLQAAAKSQQSKTHEPSEDLVRQFENFSNQVEREESATSNPVMNPSRSRVKPRAPKLRFKDRHPQKAAALNAEDPDPMEVDTDDYVYDTYVRGIMLPDADGKIPEPQGTVGFIVINEEDEEWWNGDDESDREFDTDDEDENAEDYYANDYPEDELSSDDEFGRDPYQYRGTSEDEYDLEDDANDSDGEKKESFRQTVPVPLTIQPARPGYWGRQGE